MSEISTRVWLDEGLWQEVQRRSIAEKTTVRELIPRLVGQAIGQVPAEARQPAPEAPGGTSASLEPGPPTVLLSEMYRCGVCSAQVRLTGLSAHLGKHMKERQAAEAEGG